MSLFKRLLAAGAAAGLLVGLGGATQAFATSPFSATIQWACATGGASQTITVSTSASALVHIEVTAGGSTANSATGVANASGSFTDQWTLGTASAVTTAAVRVWVVNEDGVAAGTSSFAIHPANAPCPSPTSALFHGDQIDTTQVGGTVKKTCDAGVSGSAVFAPTLRINVTYQSSLSTTITLPASGNLELACNGSSKPLPKLPVTSVITLHESRLPAGAAAAADTNITVTSTPAATTIHNAKAAVVVLPPTGQPASGPMLPWLPISLLGLIALTGAGLVLRHRS